MIFVERKRIGVIKKKCSDDKAKGVGGRKAAEANRLRQLSDANKRTKGQIKALKRSSTNGDHDKLDSDSDSDTDAGDQFDSKVGKKKQKGQKLIL